jgi:hypothetical protein
VYAVNDAPLRARWAVAWVRRGKVLRKNFGPDFSDALALYEKLLRAERKGVTLICANMEFPPPLRLQPHEEMKVKVKTVRGKRRRVKTPVYVIPMRHLNAKGIWWCPLCIKLRRFEKTPGSYVEGIWMPEEAWRCPICRIPHTYHGVRRWNPLAQRIAAEQPRRRAPRNPTTSRRRRR